MGSFACGGSNSLSARKHADTYPLPAAATLLTLAWCSSSPSPSWSRRRSRRVSPNLPSICFESTKKLGQETHNQHVLGLAVYACLATPCADCPLLTFIDTHFPSVCLSDNPATPLWPPALLTSANNFSASLAPCYDAPPCGLLTRHPSHDHTSSPQGLCRLAGAPADGAGGAGAGPRVQPGLV